MEKTKSLPVSKAMIWLAYKKVKVNQGSAGVDGQSLEAFEAKLSDNLYKLWNRMASGSYFPPAVREVEIPKKDGGKRKLGIPTVSDRIAQMVVKDLLEGRMEQIFHSNSYGYRPGKSAHQALEAVRQNVRDYAWVIDLDIKGFFDNIDHELLMLAVDKHVTEGWMKMYIRRWLSMPVQTVSGAIREKAGKGTPQGGVISPLLANLFLHYVLDKWLDKNHPGVKFVRYADDAIIHCRTQAEAETVLQAIDRRVKSCKLELHAGKTQIVYCRDYRRKGKYDKVKFDFLGFSFQPRSKKSKRDGRIFLGYDLAISKTSRKKIVEQIREMKLHRWTGAQIEEIAQKLNPKIAGWINYYGKFQQWELRGVFRMLHRRLTKWILNKYKQYQWSFRKGYQRLQRIRADQPGLFVHWRYTCYLI